MVTLAVLPGMLRISLVVANLENPGNSSRAINLLVSQPGIVGLDIVAPSQGEAESSDAEAYSRLHRELQDVLGHSIRTQAHQGYRRIFSNLNEDDLQAWLTLEAEMTLRAVSSALASEMFRATVRSALKEAMVG